MRTRSQIEDNEKKIFEPYACLSGASRGRLYPEKEHEYRTCFQRDKDRIIHTSAFRRLEYKTQVFVNHEGDYYRTRLTHTLEVSQIAKTIARVLGVNEDLTHAIALAHDLGHTPFGHAGQEVMAKLMKDFGGFEHNHQSFRIVTHLETYYPEFLGLNLSCEVLEGMMKHATTYPLPDGAPFKREGFPSIEAQICNIADAIAYNNHDIDDGIKSELLHIEDLKQVPLWQEHFHLVKEKYQDFPLHKLVRTTVRKIINFLTGDLLQNTSNEIKKRGIQTADDVKTKGENLVDFSTSAKAKLNVLKKTLFEKLYRHERVIQMTTRAQKVVSDLFHFYVKNPKQVPADFSFDKSLQQESWERIVCDYIAGMTDRFALQEYEKIKKILSLT